MTLSPVIQYIDWTFKDGTHRLSARGYIHDPTNRFFSDFTLDDDRGRGLKPSLRFIHPHTMNGTPLTNEQLRSQYAAYVGKEAKALIVNRILAMVQEGITEMSKKVLSDA